MKYYGIKSKSTYEKISFSIEKSKYFFYRNQPFSKKLRRKSQFDYDLYFNSKHFYIHDCSIPASKYCTPFCLICSDLISIENIESVKSGLKRLILHHLSNDYLTGSIDDEINKLDSLARKTPPSFSSIKIGRYSFASTETLHQKISYFTVYFKSVSSKFISVEFHIFFSNNFKEELSSFTSKNYTPSHAFIHKTVSSFSKDVGAKESSNILYYPNEILKSDYLYEKFCFIKWDFFNFIQKYFITFFHISNIIPPSVILYGTNIGYNEPYHRDFWRSVGIEAQYGETFLHRGDPYKYGRLFFRTSLSDRYAPDDSSSLIYIINTEKKKPSYGFQDFEDQIDLEFSDITTNLFLLSFLSCLSEILFPVWFYQGVEKMKYITLIRFTSIFFYTVTVFIFIKNESDYLLIPLLQSLGWLLSGVISFFMLIRVEKMSLFVPTIESIRRYFKESVPFFVSRVSVVINASMAKTICGIFFSMHEVAVFDLAQKIAMTALVPLQMLNQALFPHIAKTLDRKFVNKCFRLILLATGCIIVIVYILAPFAVFVLSDGKLPESVDILHVFSLFIFSGGITSFTGSPVLVSFGYSKPFNRSVVLSTFVLIVIYMVLYFTNSFSIINFALALGFAEFVIAIYRLYYCNRYKLIMLYGRV